MAVFIVVVVLILVVVIVMILMAVVLMGLVVAVISSSNFWCIFAGGYFKQSELENTLRYVTQAYRHVFLHRSIMCACKPRNMKLTKG